jgi:serine/threonine protein kinase
MNPGQESYAKSKTGSPYYMAPELFQDDGVYSFASDLWSFGWILYEFITGKTPFSSSSLSKLIKMVQEDEPAIQALNVSSNLKDLISKLLEKDPINRICWEELIEHPFWESMDTEEFIKFKFPSQPQFDSYLESRGINPEHFIMHKTKALMKEKAKNYTPQTNIHANKMFKVDDYGEEQVPNDDLYRNNTTRDQDFADDWEDEEAVPIDEYATPIERQITEPSVKKPTDENDVPHKPSYVSSKMKIPGQKVFDKIGSKANELPLETEEFDSNIDEKLQFNLIQAEKKDFKNISKLNQGKSRKIVSAHADTERPGVDYKYLNNWLKEKEGDSCPIALTKAKSALVATKKGEQIDKNYNQYSDRKSPSTNWNTSGKSNFTSKAKSSKELISYKNEASKSPSTLKFYQNPPLTKVAVEKKEVNSKKFNTVMHKQTSAKSNTTQRKMCPKPIEQLMIHHSDTAVKPIIGNKDIEKLQEPVYKASYLTFTPWSAEEFEKKIESQEIESFLSEIYNGIVTNSNLTERVNTLSYFESIITNSNVSNRLINSAFLTLFVHMLNKPIKSHMIKIRICSIIGLLIRHATVIENEVAESGICETLIATINDSNENVRRKAIAALGEYLFYAATQLDDDQASDVWKISQDAINAVLLWMKHYEEETVRFYACKTIENISAQSVSAGHLLATDTTCKLLLDAFLNGGKESYVNTAAVALSHICKLNPNLFSYVVEYITVEEICSVLVEGQSRLQQSFVTMLNIALLNENELLLKSINDNTDWVCKAIVTLLENQSLVIRGKSILTVVLLIKHFPLQWFTVLISDNKFITLLNRLTKDSYKYVQYGLMHFIDQVNQTMPIILKVIQEDLNYAMSIQDYTGLKVDAIVDKVMERRRDFKNLKGHMTLVSLILVLATSHLMKSRIINEHFLEVISNMLEVCEPSMFQGADEFINAVLAIIESISSNQKTLFNNSIPILQYVLPALMRKLRSESNDVKFLSLKIFTDITIQYINDENIFKKCEIAYDETNPSISKKESICRYTTELLNDILINNLFPNYQFILEDADPVPLFALKLLSALTDRSYEFVNAIERLGILPAILDFYSIGHKRLNRHTIKIIKCIVETQEISLDLIFDYQIIENTLSIIDNMLEQSQDWCFDVLTATLHSIIDRVSAHLELQETIEGDQSLEKAIESLASSVYSCIELLNTDFDFHVVDKSSQCLLFILTKFADKHK